MKAIYLVFTFAVTVVALPAQAKLECGDLGKPKDDKVVQIDRALASAGPQKKIEPGDAVQEAKMATPTPKPN